MKFSISVLYIFFSVTLHTFVYTIDLDALHAKYKNDIVILRTQYDKGTYYWPGVIMAEDKILTAYCYPVCTKTGHVFFETSKIKIKNVSRLYDERPFAPQLSVVHLEEKLNVNKTSNLFLPSGQYRPGETCVIIISVVKYSTTPLPTDAIEIKILGACCGSGAFCFKASKKGPQNSICYAIVICHDELTGFAYDKHCNQEKIRATNLFEHMEWVKLNIGTTFRKQKPNKEGKMKLKTMDLSSDQTKVEPTYKLKSME